MFKLTNILVPTDFSDCSLLALDEATRLAAQYGASIHLVHVQDGDKGASEHLEEVRNRYADFCIYPHLRQGRTADQIEACANEVGADLIAIATHGRSGLAHMLLGSVTEEVVRTSHHPVLTIRERHPRMPIL